MKQGLMLWWFVFSFLMSVEGFRLSYIQLSRKEGRFQFKSTTLSRRMVQSSLTTVDEEHEQLINEAMRNLFLEQISEEYGQDPKRLSFSDFKKRNKVIPFKSYQEPTVGLVPETPLAYVIKNKLQFGNYVGPKDNSNAVIVRSSSGKLETIDVPQIVEVWNDLADDDSPTNPTSWANVVTNAVQVFRIMSPRKSNLEEFWTLLKEMNYNIPVDSLDLSVYIFQERKFFAWMQPYLAINENENRDDYSDEDEEEEIEQNNVQVRPYTAAERYAALVLLFNDKYHFKRLTSKVSYPEEMVDETAAYDVDGEGELQFNRRRVKLEVDEELQPILKKATTFLKVGGFNVLDESICLFQETELFSKYINHRLSNSTLDYPNEDSLASSIINRLLRTLEIYSLTGDTKSPPRVIKSVLKKYSLPTNSKGAQDLLMKIGFSNKQSNDQSSAYQVRVSKSKGLVDSVTGEVKNNSYIQNITPWSKEVLEEVKKLTADIRARKERINSTPVGKVGKVNVYGRMDYRALSEEHPPICIDASYASFFDDAFSLSPSTGEILIHIADVREVVRRYEGLNSVAKQRLSTTFLPSGPLHMFPPQALEELKLSKEGPNEVITVALRIDPQTGEILRYRVFPAIIGPVYPLETANANDILDGVGITETTNEKGETVFKSKKRFSNHPDSIINDLLYLNQLVEKMCQRDSWIDITAKKKSNYQVRIDKKTNLIKYIESEHQGANRIVNTLLTLYSNSTYDYCIKNYISVPIAWENRDVINPNIPRRFATQPLRKWISLLQQQQLRSALKLELALPRDKCALAVSYHNNQRKQSSKIIHQNKGIADFEALERHYYQVEQLIKQKQEQTSDDNEEEDDDTLLFEAEGIGKGGIVRIYPYNINAIADDTVEKGELVKVKIDKLNKQTKTVTVNVVR